MLETPCPSLNPDPPSQIINRNLMQNSSNHFFRIHIHYQTGKNNITWTAIFGTTVIMTRLRYFSLFVSILLINSEHIDRHSLFDYIVSSLMSALFSVVDHLRIYLKWYAYVCAKQLSGLFELGWPIARDQYASCFAVSSTWIALIS